MLTSYYDELGKELRKSGKKAGELVESVGLNRQVHGIRIRNLATICDEFETEMIRRSYPMGHRKDMEKFHYEKLFNTLAHALAENYYYMKESFWSTRRAVATSTDCISLIQCKCTDNWTISLNVFMRSSHYKNLLPVDLLFLLRLVPRYIEAAATIQSTFGIVEWRDPNQVEYVDFNLSFGSLHTSV